MLIIIDYGIGNLKSILNMFKKVGVEAIISSDIEHITKADKFLLPGVGAFDYGVRSLKSMPFFSTLENEVLVKKKPILGICLGMQLLGGSSEEGQEQGLNWIDGIRSRRFDLEQDNLPVPHMGWNMVHPIHSSTIFEGLEESRFYFVHSYHVVCDKSDNVLATCSYGKDFVCSIAQDNIYGVQFHPEKSHRYGMRLFKNFGEL